MIGRGPANRAGNLPADLTSFIGREVDLANVRHLLTVGRLVTLLNEQLYFGHFDLWRQDGTIVFRNSLILSGGAGTSDAQCETLIQLAVEACERYFPSFQFVIWAGKTAEQSRAASLLETAGEA